VLLANNFKSCWHSDTYSSMWLSPEGMSPKLLCIIQFWKPMLISFFNPIDIKRQICLLNQKRRKSTAEYTETFRHFLSPFCISTASFPCCSWESNSDSRPLPHWLEHGGLCICGNVLSYFKVPKCSLNANMK